MSKQVIVQYESADGSIQFAMVEPTGRFEHKPSASNPDRHWQFEALDTRDGYMKLYALADIRQWSEGVDQRAVTMRVRRERELAAA